MDFLRKYKYTNVQLVSDAIQFIFHSHNWLRLLIRPTEDQTEDQNYEFQKYI